VATEGSTAFNDTIEFNYASVLLSIDLLNGNQTIMAQPDPPPDASYTSLTNSG